MMTIKNNAWGYMRRPWLTSLPISRTVADRLETIALVPPENKVLLVVPRILSCGAILPELTQRESWPIAQPTSGKG